MSFDAYMSKDPMKDVLDSLARLETKVDTLLDGDKDKEKRIRSLEQWRWVIAGGAAVAVFLFETMVRLVK